MLAVLGWPMAELVSPKGLLTESGCAPSILNGFTFASGASVDEGRRGDQNPVRRK